MTLIPYLISYFDGHISKSFYLSDYKTPKDMINACIKSLLHTKYDHHVIYVHNLANFDSNFLFNSLIELGRVSIVENKGRLISIKFMGGAINDKKEFVHLNFFDSYQILLASLSKLGKAFNCDTQKSIFPHKFVSQENLDYVGLVPFHNFFPSLSLPEYLKYAQSFSNWSLRNEAIKYCKIDCIALYQVLVKFSDLIWYKWGVNITKYPTITSLTFAIFKTHFIKKSSIAMITGDVRDYIK